MNKTLKQKFREIIRVLSQKRIETEESKRNERRNKMIVYGILTLVSLVLTILNIVNKYWLMTGTTAALTLICVICILVVWKTDNHIWPDILLSVGIGFLFSYYAASGQNDGFAILWILLVPAVGMLLLSFKAGLILSTYFLVFIVVIFYTPLKDLIPATTRGPFYTKTFMIRFPLLYLADFLTAIVLSSQKVYYLNKAQNFSLYDQLTDLRNRRYFMDLSNKYSREYNSLSLDTCLIVFDLNNLKLINDKFSHLVGDEAIKKTAELLNKHFGNYTDYIYRVGGDEFIVIFEDKGNKVDDILERFQEDINNSIYENYPLSISSGYSKKREYISGDFKTLLSTAEKHMYKHKEEYYKKKGITRYRGIFEDFD